uniref:Uncharacterized protein n=1 Tax=Tetranychus urticae TaxID=32264 RepID=T1KNV7_TETUR
MILVKRFFKALVRRKPIEEDAESKSRLVRCLNTFDLTALGKFNYLDYLPLNQLVIPSVEFSGLNVNQPLNY